jgi:16S rRNA (guanine527-N7)-methyltransferase
MKGTIGAEGEESLPLREVAAQCRELRCPVPEEALAPLARYLFLLMRWNRVMNLVGAKSLREAFALCADSFFLASFLKRLPLPEEPRSWDFGAGAGLPGVPLRMAWRAGRYTMAESREKRAVFVSTVLAELNLPRTFIRNERAETFLARETARGEHAHCILGRAFMPWRKFLDFASAGLASDGMVCIFANAPLPPELPRGWLAAGESAYAAGAARRWFWALRRS